MTSRSSKTMLGIAVLVCATMFSFAQEQGPAQLPQPADQQAPADANGGARLVLSATEWDFGTKWHGEECSTEIMLSNTGTAPLKILKVRSSCGCTVAKPKKKELAPGESDTMTITYNTKKNKPTVSQTITLETNDPIEPRAIIRVKGEVKQLFETDPPNRITFPRIDRDTNKSITMKLHNNMAEKVDLKMAEVPADAPFDVKLEAVEEGVEYTLTATTKPPLALGANVVNVRLETGLDKFPSLEVPISAYIAPRVAVTPSTLYVSPTITKSFYRVVRVTYRPDKPLQIKEIRSSHPDLVSGTLQEPRGTARSTAPTRFHEIKVQLPPGSEFPEEGAKLEIITDDPSPEYQKLEVNIRLRKLPTRDALTNRVPAKPKPAGKAEKPQGGEEEAAGDGGE